MLVIYNSGKVGGSVFPLFFVQATRDCACKVCHYRHSHFSGLTVQQVRRTENTRAAGQAFNFALTRALNPLIRCRPSLLDGRGGLVDHFFHVPCPALPSPAFFSLPALPTIIDTHRRLLQPSLPTTSASQRHLQLCLTYLPCSALALFLAPLRSLSSSPLLALVQVLISASHLK